MKGDGWHNQGRTIGGLLEAADEDSHQPILVGTLLRIARQVCDIGQSTECSLQSGLQHQPESRTCHCR